MNETKQVAIDSILQSLEKANRENGILQKQCYILKNKNLRMGIFAAIMTSCTVLLSKRNRELREQMMKDDSEKTE